MNGGFVALMKRQKPVETAQEVLERAAKKGLMKPKTKPARINSPREKPKPRAQADISRLRIKETLGANLSDNEEDRSSLKVEKPRKPRSWHGSAEDVAKPNTTDAESSIPSPSEGAPKKKGKKVKPFQF
ncbi:Putative methyltransferase nsun7 [Desmophyllum pertusum]|uniref:Methyltransferase nsun7 n=1 Tax=Desmophyllum pertusum TaxID=174260 RepID=A0A9W9YYR9_9CNID|nr:Putative methyltransferase nsun7 [Desmophyllum pertusum]